MVFVNLYRLFDKVRKEINKRLEEIEVRSHPIDFAWLLYALQNEKNTSLFHENFNKLKRWCHSDSSGKNDRDIGALAIYLFFEFEEKYNKNNHIKVIEKIEKILKRNLDKFMFKYSVINNPGEVFLLSLIARFLDENLRVALSETITGNLNGMLPRKILFLAAIKNFGLRANNIKKVLVDIASKDLERIEDLIAVIWLFNKYKEYKIPEKIHEIWDRILNEFSNIEDENSRILLSTQDLALIYEALYIELRSPDPYFMFSLYPFDEDIRKICGEYFKSEKYSIAISEAMKKLLDFLKQCAMEMESDKEKIKKLESKERDLIRYILNPRIPQNFQNRSSEEIPIKFVEQIDDLPKRNFQEGLALLFEGLWVAFRHPVAHCPENHEIRRLRPYEAISVLSLIDYLWKQIKKAKKCNSDGKSKIYGL